MFYNKCISLKFGFLKNKKILWSFLTSTEQVTSNLITFKKLIMGLLEKKEEKNKNTEVIKTKSAKIIK